MDSNPKERDPAEASRGGQDAAAGTRYQEPFGWWGYHWTPPEARSLVWLIEAGALDTRVAAFLSIATELRRSIIVVADPPGVGKTTLLTALLDFRAPGTEPVYLRGWYERFTFLETTPPERAYLLCNEISAHLPTYLWGQGVRRVFEAGMNGYAFVTTMHAGSAQEAIDLLLRYPLDVPPEHISAIDLIVSLDLGYVNNRLVRRVMRIDEVRPHQGQYQLDTVSERPILRANLTHRTGRMVASIASWVGCDDDEAGRLLSRRERLLQSWLDSGIIDVKDVRDRIQASRSS
jgi:hypothetical protein